MRNIKESKGKVYKVCKNCKREKELSSNYYMNRSKFYFCNQGRLDVCKDCLLKEFGELCNRFSQKEVVKYLCQRLDYYWNEKIYDTCESKEGNILGIYISRINSLRQYEGLTYDNREVENEDDIAFNEQIVGKLKSEAKKVMNKLDKLSENEDYGSYKNLINILKQLTETINQYDYQLKYSEYTIEDCKDENGVHSHKEVAIWKQNFDGNIKDSKRWHIEEPTACSCGANK